MAISLFIVFLAPSISALNFNISFLQSVELNKSFQVSISAETSLTYDVKMFINEDNREFSEIFYDNKWNNPYYYIKSAFPAAKSFDLRALKLGNYSLCARLRESGKSSFSESCSFIDVFPATEESNQSSYEQNISESVSNSSAENNTEDNEEDTSGALEQDNIAVKEESNIKPALKITNNPANSVNQFESDIIYLNKKPSQGIVEEIFFSKDEKIRIWMAYGFAGLCILILIFVLMRKL